MINDTTSLKIILSIALTFAAPLPTWAATTLSGRVLEKGSKKPIAGAVLFLMPLKTRTEADAKGNYSFENVDDGTYDLVITAPEYDRKEILVDIPKSASSSDASRIFLARAADSVFEFTVTGKRNRREESTQTLSQESFLTVPGASGDPVKAAQNLPGVNRTAGFSSQIIIQGSEPEDTTYQVDGHEIPLVFHFGGLSSVLFPEAVDRLELGTAGYGVERGRAMGGIVGLWTREPSANETRGLAFMDTLNAGALVEGPAGEDGFYLLSMRQSYIGWILSKVAEGNDSFNLTAAPQYRDLTGLYSKKLSDKTDFRITSFYSKDSLSFLLKEPVEGDPNFRGNLDNVTEFYRVIPGIQYRLDSKNSFDFSIGIGKDKIKVDAGENYFFIDSNVISTRGEWSRIWIGDSSGDELTTHLGWDNTYARTDFDILLPSGYTAGGVFNPFSSGEAKLARGFSKTNSVGEYLRTDWRPLKGPWTLSPNLRVDRFSTTHEWIVSPRPAIKYAVNEGLELSSSGGLYAQPPQPQDINPSFGNPDVKSPRAYHARLGFKKDFRPGSTLGFRLNGDAFWKGVHDIIIQSNRTVTRDGQTVSENTRNGAEAQVIGTQWELQYTGDHWKGALNYTLSRARRREGSSSWTPTASDQTHVATLLGSYRASAKWSYSARLRFVSGNPVTPITGSTFDSDNDVFLPNRGAYFSERLANFFQLDLRIDRKWTFETWILSAYLDIQNITNRANVESVSYSFDYTQKREATGLPIYPILGLKGEF